MALTAKTTVSLGNAVNRPRTAARLGDRLKMRSAQTNAAVYLKRHAGYPLGANQILHALCDLGACANAP